jgi:UDP-N-acetylglucosamine transferase subunit ALG13
MIFVTVGVQLPFDRLIRAVDEWAERRGRHDVVAQVGTSHYVPHALEARSFLPAGDFRGLVEQADLVVAHAGMGSIITAFELGKPIVVLPRRASLHEHRNDHQLATAQRMAAHANLRVADDEQALVRILDDFRTPESRATIASHADERLLAEITAFIQHPERAVQSPQRSGEARSWIPKDLSPGRRRSH